MVVRILHGDCRAVLPTLPAASVQCCVTSPPYYGLRDYGVAGQIGLEPTPDEYVAEMVAVFREVRRVLRDDGTLWLNIGDSYARDAKKGQHGPGQSGPKNTAHRAGSGRAVGLIQRLPQTHKHYGAHMAHCGIGEWEGACKYGDDAECPALACDEAKPKDLLGIPWLLAFALRADGWYLRSDIIWHKPNPMPESVRDRPTSAHEHVFLLSKRAAYFYDADAVREDCESGPSDLRKMLEAKPRIGGKHKDLDDPLSKASAATNIGQKRSVGSPDGRNLRNVWTIATAPFSGAHFATMPPELAERCIRAGTKPGDTVLDPFGGAGTTGLVADRLGRNATLIELNPAYRTLAADRITDDAPLFAGVA